MRNMAEKHVLQEMLDCEKNLARLYVNCASECTDMGRKDRLMQMLEEEQDMRFELAGEMQKRGWCCIETAAPEKVIQTCKRFLSNS